MLPSEEPNTGANFLAHKDDSWKGNVGFGGTQMRPSPGRRDSKPYIIAAKHNNTFVNRRCHRAGDAINHDMTRHNKRA